MAIVIAPAHAHTQGLYAQLSAAEHHACGVRADDGGIGCWGGAFRGVAIPGGGYTQVTAGGSVVCGLAANGSAACYGESCRDHRRC